MISSESPHPLPCPFSEIQCDFRSQNAPHSWVTVRDRDLPRDCVQSGGWCQQNQTKEVESRSTSSERTNQHVVKEINQTHEQSILTNQWGNQKRSRHVTKRKPKEIETCDPLVSNNNKWTPQILRNQMWVTLTHTPALPIHNGPNYQELKRERDTRTQPTGRLGLKESERERGRTLKKAHAIPECRNKL